MRRAALVGGVIAALLVGRVGRADETPPPTTAPPLTAAPSTGVPSVAAPTTAAPLTAAPSTGAPSAAVPSTAAPPTAAPSTDAPPNAVPSAAAPSTAAPSTAAPPTAAPASAVQTVAPEDAEAILGQRVTDVDTKDVGRLVDVLVGANGQPQAAVIDFGGFMGVGNRKVAVHWSALHFNPADGKHKITLDMTPDQIKAAPEFRNPTKAAAVVTPAEPAPASP
jgi:hypothetical protein